MKLGDLLVRAGYLTEDELRIALAEQKRWGGRLGEILIQKKFCTEDVVARALGKQLGLEVALLDQQIDLPANVIARLPYSLARELNVVPYRYLEAERILVVAMVDPRDKAKADELSRKTGWRIVPAVAEASKLVRARARLYHAREEEELEAEEEGVKFTDAQGRTLVRSLDDLEREHKERKAAKAAQKKAEEARSALDELLAPPEPPPKPVAPPPPPKPIVSVPAVSQQRPVIQMPLEWPSPPPRQAASRPAPPVDDAGQPSRAELLATIEALQGEVRALKAVAMVLFKKGYLTHAEYMEQLGQREP